MAKNKAQQQTLIPDPPLSAAQESALEYLAKKEQLADIQVEVKDAKDELIRIAAKNKVDVIKVRKCDGDLVIFDFTNDVKMKHTTMTDRKIEKAESEALLAKSGG